MAAAAAAAAAVAAAEANAAASAAAAVVASGNDDENNECFTLDQWAEFFKFQRGRDSPGEARNGLLVIAVLITTATYQAVLSPPGGLWQDNGDEKTGVNGHEAGKTILGSNSVNYGYGLFIISNTAGFFCSLFMIEILTEGFPLRLELRFIIIALITSYDSAMISIIPKGQFNTLFALLSIFLPLIIVIVATVVRKARILSCRRHRHRREQGHSRVSTPLQVMESSGP